MTHEQEHRIKILKNYLPHNGRALGIGDVRLISDTLQKLRPQAECLVYRDKEIEEESINILYSFGCWPIETYVDAHLEFVNKVLQQGGYVLLECAIGQVEKLMSPTNCAEWELLGFESIGGGKELCLFRVFKIRSNAA